MLRPVSRSRRWRARRSSASRIWRSSSATCPKARAFYEDLLGFEESFTLPKPDGSVDIAFVKINDRQWIELFNRPSAGEGQLNHIAIYTDDADRMRTYLASKGVAVPEKVGKGRTGNKNFMVKDPDGHNVEIVEYQPDSWTAKDAGKHLPPTRLSGHAIHVGILVGNLAAATKFYNGILGFQEFWRGSAATSKTLSWVNMRVPDGTDYVELMLYGRDPDAGAPRLRASLVPGRPRRDEGGRGARQTARARGLHPAGRGPHRHQSQAPGQPVRSRRHACRADGAEDDRRQARAVLDAAAAAIGDHPAEVNRARLLSLGRACGKYERRGSGR